MLWPSTSDAVIRAHTVLRLEAEEFNRRQSFEKRHRLLEGDCEDLVREEVRRVFADQTQADRVGILHDATCNVFAFVVDEVCRWTGARRRFVRDGKRDEVYTRIEEQLEPFDLVMQEVFRTLGGCNDGLVRVLPGRVQPDGTVARPSLRVFRPHECSVVWDEDDPALPVKVAYEQRTPSGEIEVVVWTKTEHYVVSEANVSRPARGARDNRNPYRRLPFVPVHAGMRSDTFWDETTGQDQVDFTLQFLAGWSSVRFLVHQQSHKQLAAIGVDESWKPPAKVGPGTIWKLPYNPQTAGGQMMIQTIDMQTNPLQLVDTLERALAQHLASKGLNPDQLGQNPGQAPASGLSLYLNRQRVLERRKRFNHALLEAEYAIAELYRWAWNVSHPPVDQIDPEAEFEAELIEETVVMSPREQEEHRELRLRNIREERALGLRTELEQVAEYREVSLDEARAFVAERGQGPQTTQPTE